jgi:hypothetical protein
MKTSPLATISAAAFGLCTLLVSSASAQTKTDPSVPIGTLTAYPTIVRTGTYPTLTWGINFPSTVTATVDPTTGTLQGDATMDVRVLGASVIQVSTDYAGNVISSKYVPVQVQCSVTNNGSKNHDWTQIFYGPQSQVNPTTVVFSSPVSKQSQFNFSGITPTIAKAPLVYTYGSNNNNTNNVTAILKLKDGDYPPSGSPLYGQPTVASFLQPYMNATTKQISIGPKDIIYLFELTSTDPKSLDYDFNDLALLVTFR